MKEIELFIEHYKKLGVKLWTDNGQLHFKAPVGSLTNDDKVKLKKNKLAIIEYLSALENKSVIHNAEDAYKPFILTPIQSSYLLGRNSLYDYGGVGCHAYVEIKLNPRCDVEKVTNAWHKVILRHDMLRAVVDKEGVQKVLENVQLPTVKETYIDDSSSTEEILSDIRKEMSLKKYQSDIYPLHELRITSTNEYSILHFSMDMLIADSISASIILSDILLYYYDSNAVLVEPEITFRDIVLYNQSKVNTPKYQVKYNKDLKYWKERIDTIPEEPKLPILANGRGRYEAKFDQMEFNLSKSDWDILTKTAKQKKLTGSSVIMAVFAEILSNWSLSSHFCINTTTMNRPAIHHQIYDIVGDFTNINLLEVNRLSNETFTESAVKIQTQLWTDLEHSDFNGMDVMHLLNRTRKKQISMPYVYTSTIGIKGLDDSRINVVYKTSQTPQVFIDCQVSENVNGLSVIWCVRKDVFKKSVAENMFKQFTSLTNALVNDITIWDKTYPCKSPNRELYNSQMVSKDGIHQCFDNVIGKVYNADGTDSNMLGRYLDEGKIEILGSSDNCIQYKNNSIYLDYCINELKLKLPVNDVYAVPKDNNKIDFYIYPKESKSSENISFEIEEFNNFLLNGVDKNFLVREIVSSNEIAIIELMRLFQSFDIFTDCTTGYSVEDIKNIVGVKMEYSFLMKRWLNALCTEKYISLNSDGLYYALKPDNAEKYTTLTNEIQEFINKDESIRDMAQYIQNSRDNLKDIITGIKSPLDVFFPQGSSETAFSTYNESFIAKAMNVAVSYSAKKIVESKSDKKVRILEVGAGVGGTTEEILKYLDKFTNVDYYFTDISNYFLKLSSERFKYDWIKYGIFDLNMSCWEQNMNMGSFDVIIAANSFHNAKDGNASIKILRELLAPNGYMIFLDAVNESYSLMISKSILHNEEILDSRLQDERIFFNDREWKAMFKENNLGVVVDYPQDELMVKSDLKMYVVKNVTQYEEISADDVFNAISEEIGFPEVIAKTVVSQMLPKIYDARIDGDSIMRNLKNAEGVSLRDTAEILLPTNELEEKLLDIWKNILEKDNLGINDNFFEIGGDSLLASMMITNIRKNIKQAQNIEWEKLMQIVLQNPTIKDIADVLDSKFEQSIDFCIEYQKGDDNPAQVWVLFVNGTGTMAIYNQLLQLLKNNISPNDRIIGLHCGNFDEYLSMPSEKVVEILAARNAELLKSINTDRYNFIGHCFGGGVAIQTAVYLQKENITNVSITTIDTRRWNIFCDNELIIERGFGQMSGADIYQCGHTVSDMLLQSNLERYIKRYGRLMTIDELCTDEDIDMEVKECYSKLRKIPQNERLSKLFNFTENPKTVEQEKQFVMLYKVFYQCLKSFMLFNPNMYTGEVNVIRCMDKSNFFIPIENSNESDYMLEAVNGKINNYYVDGDHFTCLLDDKNVRRVADIVLKNKIEGK